MIDFLTDCIPFALYFLLDRKHNEHDRIPTGKATANGMIKQSQHFFSSMPNSNEKHKIVCYRIMHDRLLRKSSEGKTFVIW